MYLRSARRNEDDGCQSVEAAALRRAHSSGSCARRLTPVRCPCEGTASSAVTRGAEAFPDFWSPNETSFESQRIT
jgi:hypothetical protein